MRVDGEDNTLHYTVLETREGERERESERGRERDGERVMKSKGYTCGRSVSPLTPL